MERSTVCVGNRYPSPSREGRVIAPGSPASKSDKQIYLARLAASVIPETMNISLASTPRLAPACTVNRVTFRTDSITGSTNYGVVRRATNSTNLTGQFPSVLFNVLIHSFLEKNARSADYSRFHPIIIQLEVPAVLGFQLHYEIRRHSSPVRVAEVRAFKDRRACMRLERMPMYVKSDSHLSNYSSPTTFERARTDIPILLVCSW